jgi:hypothetical protein
MSTRLRTLVILAFFAAMMGMLVRDHLLPRWRGGDGIEVGNAILADQWFGKDEWMRVRLNDQDVGAIRTQAFNIDEGFASVMKLVVDSPLLSGEVTTASVMDQQLNLRQVEAVVDFSERGLSRLELRGLVEDRTLHLRLASRTGVRHMAVPLRGPITMNTSIDALLAGEQLVPGNRYKVRVYDPVWGMETGDLVLEVTGRDWIVTERRRALLPRVEARMGNVITRIWPDANGEQARREFLLAGLADDEADQTDGSAPDQPDRRSRSGPRLVMQEMDRTAAELEFPALVSSPDLPSLVMADVTGADEGEPLQAFGFLPALLGRQIQPSSAANPGVSR